MGYSDTTVIDSQFYTYYVVAYKGATESAPSNQSTVEAGPPSVIILTPSAGTILTLGQMYDVTWQTNMPDFDAEIWLSTDGGVAWPPNAGNLQNGWAPNGSP